MSKHETMVIVNGNGINFREAVIDSLMAGWECTNGRIALGDDDNPILGFLAPNAEYLTFRR